MAAVMLSSCANDNDTFSTDKRLQLSIAVEGMKTTRTAGASELNENVVDYIDVFAFEQTAQRLEDESRSAQPLIYRHMTVDEKLLEGGDFYLVLTADEAARVGAKKMHVYVVANMPGDVSASTTAGELLESVRTIDLSQSPQPSFVMTGQAVADLSEKASIGLSRLAAKFGITVSVKDGIVGTFDGSAGTWYKAGEPEVKFYNAVAKGRMDAANAASLVFYSYDDKFYSLDAGFYSYPRKQLRAEQRPYFVIKQPIKNGPSGEPVDAYYKAYVPVSDISPNMYYLLNVNIELLGSAEEPLPEEIPEGDYSYSIAEWRTASSGKYDANAVVKDARYLVTYATTYVLDNEDELEIPFSSSHDCVITTSNGHSWDYYERNGTEMSPVTLTRTSDKSQATHGKYLVEMKQGGQAVHFLHTLDNDWLSKNSEYDVVPDTFEITIQHKNNSAYKATFTVIQNPAVVITAEYNHDGDRYINNSSRNGDPGGNLGGDVSPGTQTKFMFIISISALADDSPYVLGDPRSTTPFVWDTTRPTLANGVDIKGGANRKMTRYYATRDDGTADDIIAPKLRIQSAWGRCGSYHEDYDVLERRAASYQEGGYPAGRWRFLTKAEAKILAKLNFDKKIPLLFSNENKFVVAGGYILKGDVSDEKSTNGTAARLCYDEWYWAESRYAKCTNPKQFTWGDMEVFE